MDLIRLCFLRMDKGIELSKEFQEKVVLSRKPYFNGFFKIYMDGFLDIFYLTHFNYTLQGEYKMGVQNSNGTFDGCNGLIQRGEADAGLYLYYYPSYEDSIDISQITDEREIKILSIYNATKNERYVSILESLNSLSPAVWMVFFLYCFALGYTIRRLTPRLQKRWTIDVVLYHVLRQSPFPGRRWFPRFLSFLLSVMVLFVSLVYLCLIKTEIVVVEQPSLVNNYDDIIARLDRSTLRFESRVDEFYDFKHAKPGTKEKFIWDSIQDRNFHANLDPVLKMIELWSGESIEIHDSEFGQIMMAIWCTLKVLFFREKFEGAFPWISKDPSSRKIQVGYVLRRGVNPAYKSRLLQKASRITEHGLYVLLMKMIISESKMSTDQTRSDFRKCVSGKLQMPAAGDHPLRMENFRRLAYYSTLVIYLAWMVLGLEFFVL